MGRIKTMLVKSIAKKLIKEHGQEFTPDFDKNKELVQKYTTVSSPKLRNIIAGYTARLVKQKTISEKQPRKRLHEEDFSKFYQ
ncbi:30S ribosomal protein S17e [Candidatus Woesearchaeota archaeon]|jgi:small subunit ribosomal protein S17e|nr:30S ribosomal protein S17e [Candidatus Woesearchaeota archaeon]MDP6648332.1 30S ribosomal protein S17e [Candidatus Woesearchaeota archaeon]